MTTVQCVCRGCGITYGTPIKRINDGRGKYCSHKCYCKSTSLREMRICKNCGNEFESRHEEFNRGGGKYCSSECYHKSRIGVPVRDPSRLINAGRLRRGSTLTEATIKKISKSRKGKGVIHGNRTVKYCYKFYGKSGVQLRALMFYKFACVECGKTQAQNREETKCRTQPNGKALSVHHVYYRKMGCCENEEEYESGVRKVGNTLYIREYDGTENVHVIQGSHEKFVALCSSCHNKSNLVNRAYWIKYYEDLVNTKYGGKCYLTKDEMVAYQP